VKAREVSNEVYLKATAATFRESWRMVDAVIKVAAERSDAIVSRARAEDIMCAPPSFVVVDFMSILSIAQLSNVRGQYG
jgi:hypothetical protein